MSTLTTHQEHLEEILNALSHGVGAALALAGLTALVITSYIYGTIWHQVSFIIYGVSLFLLYLASTLYHSFKNERLKYIFKICDHSAIYLLIAGSYTPFALVLFRGVLGWTIFGIVWSLAAIGVILKIFFVKKFKVISTLCYLGMGWLAIIFIKPLLAALPVTGLYWLIAGGLSYTIGAVFYLCRQLPYNHTVWHFFVIAGSACHFITILFFVLPIATPA
ncbi:MAG: hypothetical protein H6Q74_1482 [Firmicutes bacterium]|nr:hypothetical protein [Bacillota bacterium]